MPPLATNSWRALVGGDIVPVAKASRWAPSMYRVLRACRRGSCTACACYGATWPTTLLLPRANGKRNTPLVSRVHVGRVVALDEYGIMIPSVVRSHLWGRGKRVKSSKHFLPVGAVVVLCLLASSYILSSRYGGAVTFISPLTVPHPPHAAPRTLIIIQGAWREFSRVVDLTIENIVLPHEPCDVVLSLDWRGPEDTREVLNKLAPYLVGVLYPSDDTRNDPIVTNDVEFTQIVRALDVINVTKYEYILKTRTDLAHLRRFSFATAAGYGADFLAAFSEFMRSTRRTQPDAAPCDVITQWIFSAGMPVYQPFSRSALGDKPPRMIFVPVHNLQITPHLVPAIKALCASSWGGNLSSSADTGWRFLEENGGERARKLVRDAVTSQHVMWMQGNTWMSWGARDDFVRVHYGIYTQFKKGAFQDGREITSFNWLTPTPWPNLTSSKWKWNTEAIFRLMHPLMGTALVELRHSQENYPSFHRKCYWHCLDTSELREIVDPPGAFIIRKARPDCPQRWWEKGSIIPGICVEPTPSASL